MNFPRLYAFTLLAVAISNNAQSQDSYAHCTSVYLTATRNLNITNNSYSQLNAVFDEYCSQDGSMKTASGSANFEAVVKKIPIKFHGDSASSEQKVSSFCRQYNSIRYEAQASSEISDTVVTEALRLLNDCVRATQAGLIIELTSADQINFALRFEFSTNLSPVKVQGAAVGSNLTCTTQIKKEDGSVKRLTLDEGTYEEFQSAFNIICKRNGIKSASGDEYYPPTSFVIATNLASYGVNMPAEQISGEFLASDIYQKLISLNDRIDNHEASINQRLSVFDQQHQFLANRVSNFVDNLDVETFILTYGDTELADFELINREHLNCGEDVYERARQLCTGGALSYDHLIFSGPNGQCGYSAFEFVCIEKPY